MLNQVPPAEVLECAPDENHALSTVGLESSDGPIEVPGDERCLNTLNTRNAMTAGHKLTVVPVESTDDTHNA